MTGRELIIYILSNHLEDEPVIKDGKLIGFLSVDEAAIKKNVGSATIEALIELGHMDCHTLNDVRQIPVRAGQL